MKRLASLYNRFLSRSDPDGTHYHLSRLWRHWPEIVGPQIAALARPVGHRGTTLIVGTEDHMVAQELTMYAPALLEQANGFLGMNFFDKVRVDLLGDHVSLDTIEQPAPCAPLRPGRPGRLGGLAGRLDPASPVARCYEAYLRSFEPEAPGGAPAPDKTTSPKEDETI
ncbi:DUF721 domain-containing protein [Desulfocurvus sp.]|jgi:hypothetical protein|uniref:DUF721 domain-containing protein n=1 Tax=Desulfocurvus sp. TaxID=2871698 RepID=UPI0025BD4E44|nr:DUF721 domain-containing protein [Desulfocurvus sp.]MCK9240059.1 DUF721 domain-containing protein [Desulfocurvus sp.]